ncbi:MAG: GAF domain-containing protein [Microscillaceae bacterium]|nr:GAF domain-containing protein [Microscillaceae bacterium]
MLQKGKYFSEDKMPFHRILSLAPLLHHLEKKLKEYPETDLVTYRKFMAEVREIPALWQPIYDLSLLETHKERIKIIINSLFPVVDLDYEARAAVFPLQFKALFSSPGMNKILDIDSLYRQVGQILPEDIFYQKVVYAYIQILQKIYGAAFTAMEPIVITLPEPETQLERHYQVNLDMSFMEIRHRKGWPDLHPETIQHLRDNVFDLQLLFEALPPQEIEFVGFALMHLFDITDQKAFSDLKDILLEREVLHNLELYERLQQKIRAIFHRPDLRVGISLYDYRQNAITSSDFALWHSMLHQNGAVFSCSEFKGCIYDQALHKLHPIVIPDLLKLPHPTEVEKALIAQGVRSLLIVSLVYDEKILGVLEICAPEPNVMDYFAIERLENIVPLFSLAVHRGLEDMENRIEAIIQKEFTAIHPTVAWKFREVAAKLKTLREKGQDTETEPIVFEEVYPLFGQSDVRGSSTLRNESIQADLIHQLSLINHIIRTAQSQRYLPILEELDFRVHQHITEIEKGLNAGDEINVLEFIKKEVEPLFNLLQASGTATRTAIQEYWEAVDGELGFVYQKRKAFEQSLTRLNEAISTFLDKKEAEAQAMFPHYFEKYKTDGVEHNIYIGNSLVQAQNFELIYLKNLRLWQLQTMAEIARLSEKLKADLEVPLDATHLILVHSAPLAIRFRQEEKQFDVDGAYNIRYEIVKSELIKPISKARRNG